MDSYCEGCIHFALQPVACTTDREKQILYEPACMAERCIREEKESE